MSRTSSALLAVAVAAGLLGGCGRSAPAPAPAPASLDAFTLDLITGSGDYPERQRRVELAEVALTRECMRAAGFAWEGAVAPPNPEAREGGGVSLEHIRRHGYDLSNEPTGTTPGKEPGTAGPVADETALRAALFGRPNDLGRLASAGGAAYEYPRGGCGAKAAVALYGDVDTWARFAFLPQEANFRLDRQARQHPRYAAKLAQWRACMGGRHESPDAIVAGLREAYRTDRRPLAVRRAAEIKLALQDVSCNKRVRLSATTLELRRELAQSLPADERRELSRLATVFPQVEIRSSRTPTSS